LARYGWSRPLACLYLPCGNWAAVEVEQRRIEVNLEITSPPRPAVAAVGPPSGSNRSGANATTSSSKVPNGTIVLDRYGNILADLMGAGTQFVAAAGGKVASATRRWPRPSARPRGSRSRASRVKGAS